MRRNPMISSRALTNMPELIHSELGSKGLEKAFLVSGLNEELIGAQHHYVLQSSLSKFVDSAAQQLGEEKLGLLLAPNLSINHYGVFGEYVTSGATLEDSLKRSCEMIKFHGSHDTITLSVGYTRVSYQYNFASAHLSGYQNLAYCAVGVMLSIVREYLGKDWLPNYIELDFPKPPGAGAIEENFGTNVIFGAKSVGLVFNPSVLGATRTYIPKRSIILVSDVLLKRRGLAPIHTVDIVRELIGTQIFDANVSLDRTANELGLSIRSLQRVLDGEGTNFRSLVNDVTAKRAVRLLLETDYSIAMISENLGYSNPAHFTRAFKKQVGTTPMDYKKTRDE